MLTLLVIVAVAIVLFVAAAVATYEGDVLAEAPPDRADVYLPPGRVVAEDLRAVRFGMALRGYRMGEVDLVLDRLERELADRDARIADLERVLTEVVEPAVAEAEDQQRTAHAAPAPEPAPEPASEPEPEPEPAPAPAPEPAPWPWPEAVTQPTVPAPELASEQPLGAPRPGSEDSAAPEPASAEGGAPEAASEELTPWPWPEPPAETETPMEPASEASLEAVSAQPTGTSSEDVSEPPVDTPSVPPSEAAPVTAAEDQQVASPDEEAAEAVEPAGAEVPAPESQPGDAPGDAPGRPAVVQAGWADQELDDFPEVPAAERATEGLPEAEDETGLQRPS